MLHEKYGKKVTIALCAARRRVPGPARRHLLQRQGRPAGAAVGARRRGRGDGVEEGQGDRGGPRQDPAVPRPKKVNVAIKDYAKMLLADTMVTSFYQKIGTMGMADLQNALGGLPVRNFSAGQLVDAKTGEKFKMGGELHQPAQRLARRRAHARLHARLRHPVQQRLRRRQRQGSGLAGGIRDARPARHQLRPERSRRARPAELPGQRPRGGHDRARRHAGRADGGGPRRLRRREVHGRLHGRDAPGHREGPPLGAGHGARGRALQGPPRAGHQEAGDQRLRSRAWSRRPASP